MVPDIVICDLVLPDHNGLEFIRWLRARSADQSGATPAAGFDMFIRKPIDPMDIVQAVTRLVRRSAPS